jgi:preprotein translocase subunit SecA
LVEYRRQSQRLFDELQANLRHDVLRMLFHAQPVAAEEAEKPVETELTRAARRSISNANKIIETDAQFKEGDFAGQVQKATEQAGKKTAAVRKKKTRKAERQRRVKARRRK